MSTTPAWILIEREHGIPLLVGPYAGPISAAVAMDSSLVDGLAEEDAVDISVVHEQPTYPVEVVVIDPHNRDHTDL